MFPQLLSVFAQLWPHVAAIRDEIQTALEDGSLPAKEASAIGVAVSDELGDIRIVVKGTDVLRRTAQRELMSGCARVILRVCQALKEDR